MDSIYVKFTFKKKKKVNLYCFEAFTHTKKEWQKSKEKMFST